MYTRKYQRKRPFRRPLVTLLALVMLLSVCFPGLVVRADDGAEPDISIKQGGTSAPFDYTNYIDGVGTEGLTLALSMPDGLTFNSTDGTTGTITASEHVQPGTYTVKILGTPVVTEEETSNNEGAAGESENVTPGTESAPTVTDTEGTGTESDPAVTNTEGSGTESGTTATDTEGTGTESNPTVTDTEGSGTESDTTVTDTEGSGTESNPTVTDTEGTGTESDPTVTDTEGNGTESAPTVTDAGNVAPLSDTEGTGTTGTDDGGASTDATDTGSEGSDTETDNTDTEQNAGDGTDGQLSVPFGLPMFLASSIGDTAQPTEIGSFTVEVLSAELDRLLEQMQTYDPSDTASIMSTWDAAYVYKFSGSYNAEADDSVMSAMDLAVQNLVAWSKDAAVALFNALIDSSNYSPYLDKSQDEREGYIQRIYAIDQVLYVFVDSGELTEEELSELEESAESAVNELNGAGQTLDITSSTAGVIPEGVTVYMYNYDESAGNFALPFYNSNNTGEEEYPYHKAIPEDEHVYDYSADGVGTRTNNGGVAKNPSVYLNGAVAPTVTTGSGGTANLSSLFATDSNAYSPTVWKVDAKDSGGLFRQRSDGTYYYSSSSNAAYFDGSNFTLYDTTMAPYYERLRYREDQDSHGNKYWEGYRVQNFFPFNELNSDTAVESGNDFAYLKANNDGTPMDNNKVDCWFGMMIEIDFWMPEGGTVDSQQMVFSFTGDDDVYVYIDDVLMLDLGGCHNPLNGTINFATGQITQQYYDDSDKLLTDRSNTIASRVRAAIEAGMSRDAVAIDGDTYAAYTKHTLKFFYLERGGVISYCDLSFKLPPMPDDILVVGKLPLETTTDVSKDAVNYLTERLDFRFRVMDANGTAVAEQFAADKEFDVYEGTTNIGSDTVKSGGIFTLKAGQHARFNLGTNAPKTYIVQELIPSGFTETYEGTRYIVDGKYTDGQEISYVTIDGVQYEVRSVKVTIPANSSNAIAMYENTVSIDHSSMLKISKVLATGQTSDQEFQFKVTVGGTPLANQSFTITDSTNGTSTRSTDSQGVLTLYAGETAILDKFLVAGTTYAVEELAIDATGNTKWKDPRYSTTITENNIAGTPTATNSGTIGEDVTVTVTVTNEQIVPDKEDEAYIRVQKTFSGLTTAQIESLKANFTIMVGEKPLKLTDANVQVSTDGMTYTWIIQGVPAGSYVVNESGADLDGYDLVTTGTGDIVTISPSTTTFKKINDEPSCSGSPYNVGDIDYVVVKLTSGSGYFVWTRTSLSYNQRQAMLKHINDKINAGGIGYGPNITLDACIFYSGDKIEDSDGLYFRGGTIKYDPASNQLSFTGTKLWAQFAYGTYNTTEAANAEIPVTNTYTPSTTSVTITKDVDGNIADYVGDFEFEVISDKHMAPGSVIADTSTGSVAYEVEDYGTNQSKITFSIGDGDKVIIKNVPIGATLSVTEKGVQSYKVEYMVGTGNYNLVKEQSSTEANATFNNVEVSNGLNITVRNTNEADIDTGITTTSYPFILLLSTTIVAGFVLLMHKRRYTGKF